MKKPPLRPQSSHRREYERRVNRVMDHVQAHLAEELTLERLAAVAAFSPFHFHRVFAGVTGETLSDYIRRIRLERSASSLVMLPETSVLEIALRCGFSSAASFARAFKGHFGMSATQWRDGGARRWGESKRRKADSKLGKALGKAGKASREQKRHHASVRNDGADMPVEIRKMPPCRVAYMRHVGPYGVDGGIGLLWKSFERWIKARGLRRSGTQTIGIGHDAPRIVEADKLRYDACLVVDADFKADRFVNTADLPGGTYAVVPFEGTPPEISTAWERLFAWLPGSGYQPDERPCLELRHDLDPLTSTGRLRCELCLPVGPL